MNANARTSLIARASAQVAQYPQYAGKFDGHVLATMRKAVKGKGGQYFTKGEIVLVDPASRRILTESYVAKLNGREMVTAWSMASAMSVSIFAADVIIAEG